MSAPAEPHTFVDDPSNAVRGLQYRAAEYCVPCGVRAYLRVQGTQGHGLSYIAQQAYDLLGRFTLGSEAFADERNWDSDDFPKVLGSWHDTEGRTCDTCGCEIS